MNAVKKKSKKKLIITLVVIGVVIAVLFVGCTAMVNKAKKTVEAAMNAMQTDVVSMRELTKSIGATGTVVSVQSEDVTAALAGAEILQILADVGDTVEEGQPLVEFDTEDLEENLAIAQKALNQTQGQFGISGQNAQRTVEDARRGADYQAEVAWSNMQQAYDAYVSAFEDLEDLEEAEDDAWDAMIVAQEEYEAAVDSLRGSEDTEELLEQLPEEVTQQTLQQVIEAVQSYYAQQQLSQQLTQLATAAAQAEAGYEQARAARETLEDNIPKLHDSYQLMISTYENTVASGESSVEAAKAAQQSAELSVNTDQQQKQIDTLTEQLEDGIVTAPISGVVTAVNYDPGDLYAQGAIMTIQDVSAYEIEAQIGEYDISDIELGQKVIIKTDATREQELEGTVVFISPTATAAMGAGDLMTATATMSTDPTYEIRISVDTPSDRLRLDMTANLSIIIQEQTAAMTVPYNAVQTAEDGTHFVETVGEDGQTLTVVPVKVVMESNYYTQIEGDLQEGQTVRLITQQTSDMFSVMSEMSPMGGGF